MRYTCIIFKDIYKAERDTDTTHTTLLVGWRILMRIDKPQHDDFSNLRRADEDENVDENKNLSARRHRDTRNRTEPMLFRRLGSSVMHQHM